MFYGNSRHTQCLAGGGFHSAPPSSRPPTKIYDRQSYVLVVDESDDTLKFMKMHLNRYFSHVVVAKNSVDGLAHLKLRDFNLVITEANPVKKANADFVKKVAAHWRDLPIILTSSDSAHSVQPEEFLNSLVVDIINKPLDMDMLHVAIRRALSVRPILRELHLILPPKTPLGTSIRAGSFVSADEKVTDLVEKIRHLLFEAIVD